MIAREPDDADDLAYRDPCTECGGAGEGPCCDGGDDYDEDGCEDCDGTGCCVECGGTGDDPDGDDDGGDS